MSSKAPPAAAWLARAALALLGCAAVTWAWTVLPAFRAAVPIRDVTEGIIADQRFKPGVLDDVQAQLAARPRAALELPMLARAQALVRLRTAEQAMDRQGPEASDRAMDAAEAAVKATLAINPRDSFLWLMLYSLTTTRGGFDPANLALLDRSYATGPHDGWIALRRNRLALAAFAMLSEATQMRVVDEFAEIVDADFLGDAELNLTTVGWAQRDRLAAGLGRVDMTSREAFARMLSKDAYAVQVPGVKPTERPW
jgi:hypothetical protein